MDLMFFYQSELQVKLIPIDVCFDRRRLLRTTTNCHGLLQGAVGKSMNGEERTNGSGDRSAGNFKIVCRITEIGRVFNVGQCLVE